MLHPVYLQSRPGGELIRQYCKPSLCIQKTLYLAAGTTDFWCYA